jgi:PhnB protein
MKSLLNPYLNFKGKAREALVFYHAVFGGKLEMTTYKEGGMSQGEATDNLIMHGMFEAENGMTMMVSDSPEGMPYTVGNNISISLSGDNEDELRGYWSELADGGMVTVPLEKAPWGDTFGMLVDRFGIGWMVNVAGKKS